MSRVLYRLAQREVSLFSIYPENTLKTRAIQRYIPYRLRGILHYFSTYPLCLFSAPPQNILKTRVVPYISLLQTAEGPHLSVTPVS